MLFVSCRRLQPCCSTASNKNVKRALRVYRSICVVQIACVVAYLIVYPYIYDTDICVKQNCYVKNDTIINDIDTILKIKSTTESTESNESTESSATNMYLECKALPTLEHSVFRGSRYCHFSDCHVVGSPLNLFLGFAMEQDLHGKKNAQQLCIEHTKMFHISKLIVLRLLFVSFHIYVIKNLLRVHKGKDVLPKRITVQKLWVDSISLTIWSKVVPVVVLIFAVVLSFLLYSERYN